MTTPLCVCYRNHRGEVRVRRILPRRVWFGSTEWHPEPQWMVTAEDVERGVTRDFAWTGFLPMSQGPCHAVDTWEGSNAFPGNDPC